MMFKVGDIVTVRSDIADGQEFDGLNWSSARKPFAGKKLKITRI